MNPQHQDQMDFTFDDDIGHPPTPPPTPPQAPPQPDPGNPVPQYQDARVGRPRQRIYHYPNQHLEPNIDIAIQRRERTRQPCKQYDAHSGAWN